MRGVATFGVFVDLGGGRSGLVHISEVVGATDGRRDLRRAGRGAAAISSAAAVLARFQKGDPIDVVVVAVGDDGRINLSERAAIGQRESGSGDGSEWTTGGGWDGEKEDEEGPATPRAAEAARRRL